MSRFFKPYEGKRPYLFVSYSHRQSDAVVDTIRLLHEKHWRVWYDEGIPAGSDWPKNIESHMRQCGAVLFFLSKSSLASPNCFSEIKTATGLRKSVLVIPLEEAEIGREWEELLKKATVLPALPSAEERAAAIEKNGAVRRGYRRTPLEGFRWDLLGLAASALIFALTIAALYGLFTGGITLPGTQTAVEATPEPVVTPTPTPAPEVDLSAWEGFFPVSFPDEQQERAVRALLEKGSENVLLSDLPAIRELYFCGNMSLRSLDGVAFDEEGTLTVNGARVIEGKVSDLSVIGRMPQLETLALIRQPLEDLSPLAELSLLRELSLAGSGPVPLEALGVQPSLEKLHLEHSAVRDLTALRGMSALRTVTVSADMVPLQWNEGAGFDLILVK